MEEASNQTHPKPPQSMTPSTSLHFQTLNPIRRLSPRHNGSTLYDSYELQAVTHQLNKAIRGSNDSSSPYMSYLRSPFYCHRLGRILKENAKTKKKISCTQSPCVILNKKEGERSAVGSVRRLWKKIKEGLVRNKQMMEG